MKRKKEKVQNGQPANSRPSWPVAAFFLLPFTFFLLLGCADNKANEADRKSIHERQDDALHDPFSFGPQDHKAGSDIPTVTGGKSKEENSRGLRRDLDRFLNP